MCTEIFSKNWERIVKKKITFCKNNLSCDFCGKVNFVNDIEMYITLHVLICVVKNYVIFPKSKPLMLLLLCVKIITIYEFPWSFPQINYFS